VAWEALENAGYDPEQYPSPIGVYAGGSPNVYVFHLMAKLGTGAGGYGFPLTVSNEKDYLATRVSYELNLKGPSVTVQTACSTSLVAVHMACRSLLGGECTVALAGAVNVNVPQEAGYLYQEGGIVSPDGHCRVFDAAAGGTVFGNGLGIVVLKRLSEAIADGDTIHAVIKGTAINNDGSGKVGFTAPSVDGQAECIEMAHAAAGLTADTISYVEAHGTGTVLGDPIEIAGLTQAFRSSTDKSGFCALGSVKTNIGHLDAAAGMAGLLKTVLALQHRELPPTLHFQRPNPKIDFSNSPFVVNAALSPWNSSGAPRRAGVSCFGVGGTNSHVVVEEAPVSVNSDPARPRELLVFSAKTKPALEQTLKNFAGYLKEFPATNLGDVSFTLQVGRRALEHRCALVAQNREDAIRMLETKEGLIQSTGVAGRPQVVFMFSGQGAQYSGMAAELYKSEPFFARTIDECLEMAKPHLPVDLRAVLFGDAAAGTADINQTALTQPALFVVEYSMARLWMSWGITPESMIGHSIGEYAAACLAGVLALKDVIELVAARGRLMQQLPAGSMLAVPLNEAAVEAVLKTADPTGRISIAALNAPGSCVLSGPTDALAKLEAHLMAQGTAARKLHTSHAFHSSMMDPVLDEFTAIVSRVKLNPPRLPYVSNLTGTWIRPEEATDPRYYARHLRQAVRFSAGIQELVREPDRVFLEVGPGQTLTTLTRRHPHNGRPPLALPSLRAANDAQSDVGFLLNTVGRLWLSGARIAWAGFTRGVVRRRIPLPTYPFEHERYTVDMAPAVAAATEEAPAAPFVHARPEVQTDYVAPQTDREKAIARVWQRCLGIDRIGLHDNFFELGGDSLLAGQVVTEIRNEVHVPLQLVDFFAAPTIARLIPLLDTAVAEPVPAALPDRREPRRDLAGQRLRRQQARPTIE
jgi:phthiocerol/phenolphthiocerol synthesis type-I polyketide synthase E